MRMDTSSLLDKLPAEIRNDIYRYVLSTTHTKIVVDPGSYVSVSCSCPFWPLVSHLSMASHTNRDLATL